MGNAMAQNLQKKSSSKHSLRFFNRTPARGKDLHALGATLCDSIASLVEESDVIFTSVSFYQVNTMFACLECLPEVKAE